MGSKALANGSGSFCIILLLASGVEEIYTIHAWIYLGFSIST